MLEMFGSRYSSSRFPKASNRYRPKLLIGPGTGVPSRIESVLGQPHGAPRHQVELLAQRERVRVVAVGPAFDFGKRHLGRQPRHRRRPVHALGRVEQHETAADVRMMGGRGEDDLRRAGDRAGLEHAVRRGRQIAEHGPGTRSRWAAWTTGPCATCDGGRRNPSGRTESGRRPPRWGSIQSSRTARWPASGRLRRPSCAACGRSPADRRCRRSARTNPAGRLPAWPRHSPGRIAGTGRGGSTGRRSRRSAGSGRRSRRTCRASAAAGRCRPGSARTDDRTRPPGCWPCRACSASATGPGSAGSRRTAPCGRRRTGPAARYRRPAGGSPSNCAAAVPARRSLPARTVRRPAATTTTDTRRNGTTAGSGAA